MVRALFALSLFVSAGFAAAAVHPAYDMVKSTTEQMLDFLDVNREAVKTDRALLDGKVAELILPNLDFDAMTKLAVGKNWRDANEAQRDKLTAEFRDLLVRTYTKSLTEYSGQKIEFLPYRPQSREDRALVQSKITQPSGQAIGIDYSLRDKDGWGIYDISIDGISLVTSYRTGFAQEVQRGGIDGLIASLVQKNQQSAEAKE
jgi:phospholipid transport system substrate-binding protein